MRKKIMLWIVVALVAVIVLLPLIGATTYSPADIPFAYDATKITNKLLGGIEGRAANQFTYDIDCYDPDGDPFFVEILNPEPGMTIAFNVGTDKWEISWAPSNDQAGLYYIVVKATDVPPVPDLPLSDTGTIVFNVNSQNRPPVLLPR